MSDSLEPYRATMKRRGDRARREQEERRQHARRAARRAAQFLQRMYGVDRVILFGSMAGEDPLSPHSDIDLAVSGLSADDYYESVARVQTQAAPFHVDLIRMEQAVASLRAAVQREGRPL